MINNLPALSSLINFDSEDDFYSLEIIQRRKENPNLDENSRIIRSYNIRSKDHLDRRFEEIVNLCKFFNARAMINLNKRSFRRVGIFAMKNLIECMGNESHSTMFRCYDRAVGQSGTIGKKVWIIDIDERYTSTLKNKLKDFIRNSEPKVGSCKILNTIPSRNGTHVLTRPFNLKGFKEEFPDLEVHKNNPTNLIII